MAITIHELQPNAPSQETAWDQFVRSSPNGTVFHLTAWKQSIEETFGYEPVYLVCEDGARVRGVLPLFYVDNLLMGKALISSPFAVYGGVAATPLRITAAEDVSSGQLWNEAASERVQTVLDRTLTPLSDVRGSKDYRLEVAKSLVEKFYWETRS